MKKFALLLSLALVAAVAAASQETKPEATKPAAAAEKATAGKTHEMTAEIAAVDAEKKTLTIKGEAGAENKTVPVEGKAIAQLKTAKAGQKVTLVCQDNEKGEHQAVVAIKPAKEPEKK